MTSKFEDFIPFENTEMGKARALVQHEVDALLQVWYQLIYVLDYVCLYRQELVARLKRTMNYCHEGYHMFSSGKEMKKEIKSRWNSCLGLLTLVVKTPEEAADVVRGLCHDFDWDGVEL